MKTMVMVASVLGILAAPALAGGSYDDTYECKLPEKYLCGDHGKGKDRYKHAYGRQKVAVCHRGRTIQVALPALKAHLRHGDREGPCGKARAY